MSIAPYLRWCFQVVRFPKILKWVELSSCILWTLLLHHILWKFLLMNWKAVIINFVWRKHEWNHPNLSDDVQVRYWHKSENQIKYMCYIDSKFMGDAAANDLLTNFIDIINNVVGGNHMIHEMLQKDCIEKEQHELFNIGLCSFYIIHSPFKTGTERSGWNIQDIFKGVFTNLNNNPNKKGVLYCNNRERRKIPLILLCNTVWMEETVVADRLVETWDSIIKIVSCWETLPKS